MLTDDDLREQSRRIRSEATKVLELTGIEKVLQRYGTVELLGSYAYDVMLARDIDFHVVVPVLEPPLAHQFFDWAASSGRFEYVSFHDKHGFNRRAAGRYPTKQALDSYYFGLRLWFDDHEWQIGINFITAPQHISEEIVVLMSQASEEQRRRIIRFKYELQQLDAAVSSAFVYRGVLEQDKHTMSELVSYLSTLGYQIGPAAGKITHSH